MSEWRRQLLSNSLWMFLGLLFGRLTGFAREIVLAARFGAGAEADIAILMLTLPDMLVGLLVGGALSVALIPAFKRYGTGYRSYCLFAKSSVLVAIVFTAVVVLLSLFIEPLIGLVAPGFSAQQMARSVPLLGVVLWLIPLTVLAGVSTAFLQSAGRFGVSAFNTFSFNSVVLMGLGYSIATDGSLQDLALFILAGGVLRWVVQLLALPRIRLSRRCLGWRLLDRELMLRFVHAMTAGGLLLLMPVVARAMASLHGEGGLSLFSYAMKLVEFPLSLGVMVLSAGIFPLFAHCFARREEPCDEMVATGIQLVLLITVSMMLPLGWFARDIATLVFGYGAMENEQVMTIGNLMGLGVIGLPLQGLATLLTATYNAARDTAYILRLNIITVALFALSGYLSIDSYGLPALMLSLVFSYGVLVIMQLLVLKRRLSVSLAGELWKKRLHLSLLAMLLTGGGLVALVQWFELGTLLNVALAVLISGVMLLTGTVAGGAHKTLIRLFSQRLAQ